MPSFTPATEGTTSCALPTGERDFLRPVELVCTDMDGTVLGPDHSIHEVTFEKIHRAQKLGCSVIPATGRCRMSAAKCFSKGGIDLDRQSLWDDVKGELQLWVDSQKVEWATTLKASTRKAAIGGKIRVSLMEAILEALREGSSDPVDSEFIRLGHAGVVVVVRYSLPGVYLNGCVVYDEEGQVASNVVLDYQI
ncbi:hypothetical protein FOZ62_027070, partial [Perkinsus olseni]